MAVNHGNHFTIKINSRVVVTKVYEQNQLARFVIEIVSHNFEDLRTEVSSIQRFKKTRKASYIVSHLKWNHTT